VTPTRGGDTRTKKNCVWVYKQQWSWGRTWKKVQGNTRLKSIKVSYEQKRSSVFREKMGVTMWN